MATYQIDPAHSAAQFKVRHMMIANVKGEFHKVSGTVNFDFANPSAATVEASIDVSTISTRETDRDNHLKSPDFLDVARYPNITFKSKTVTPKGESSFSVIGDLTIRDKTREVTLDVEELTGEAKDPWGNIRRGATAKTTINRKDFGMEFNVVLETGGFLVGDTVELTLDVEMIRQA